MDGERGARDLESEPDGLLASRLIDVAAEGRAVIVAARSETRAARLYQAASALNPALAIAFMPAWDCLPYDRASPSRGVMGHRMAVLRRLAESRDGPLLLIGSAPALTQRLPPPSAWEAIELRVGQPLSPEDLGQHLERLGYDLDERAEEPGEAAIRVAVVDVFPPTAALPCRAQCEDGRITELREYDPATQRSQGSVETLLLGPASEVVLPAGSGQTRLPGMEHGLASFYPNLVTVFDLLPEAALVLDAGFEELHAQLLADFQEAYDAVKLLPATARRTLSPPASLWMDRAAWEGAIRRRDVRNVIESGNTAAALPRFRGLAAFRDFVRGQSAAGLRVGLAGPAAARRLLLRALDAKPERYQSWPALKAAPAGTIGLLDGALDGGFVDNGTACVIAPSDVLGARERSNGAGALPAVFEAALAPGDAVIHLDHGMGALRGIEAIAADEVAADCFRLEYAGESKLLVPADEMSRLWRYGADAGAVTLDRLQGESWPKRRVEIEADIAETAARLVALARARDATEAPIMHAQGSAYGRLAARFPHAPTPDQAAAIAAVESDLAAGRPMDRLVCGDVGYGKTEIALRAAAIAALAGFQVAIVAPTTVLVRQHLQTFTRRFAGLGVRIAGLSRLTPAAEARAVRAGLADGGIGIVIGTQALAGRTVRFAKLGLLIVDEEQRFGVRQKAALRRLGDGAHVLAVTATPIPRTLQTALAGLQSLSVLATPPARRQPVRGFRMALDETLVAQALRREQRRGGQSFFVCPRVEDIAPMRERLDRAAPELEVIEAHGGMKPDALDDAMLRFANGEADVLLATNIIEAGLDLPRANTMLIWRPDRFGLAQLHQLRGRVGRGGARGLVYLLTDPDAKLAAVSARRLDALESHDRLGAGFAISARDLDLRGAGDLLGEDQAGHVKLIGLDLYQHLLGRAMRIARGESVPEEWAPELRLDAPAFLPSDYVSDETARVRLHDRLARAARDGGTDAITLIEDEIEDRFGPLPEPVRNLVALAHVRAACFRAGVRRLDVGPAAAAATLREAAEGDPPPPLERRGERLVLSQASRNAAERIAAAWSLLDRLDA